MKLFYATGPTTIIEQASGLAPKMAGWQTGRQQVIMIYFALPFATDFAVTASASGVTKGIR